MIERPALFDPARDRHAVAPTTSTAQGLFAEVPFRLATGGELFTIRFRATCPAAPVAVGSPKAAPPPPGP